jgi:two-component system, NtrC family, sensor kinase
LKSLVTRYWLVISLLIGLTFGIVGAFELWLSYRGTLDNIRVLQEAASKTAAVRIEEHLKAIEGYIREVGSLPWSSGIFSEEDRRAEFQRLLKLVPAVLELRAIDAEGRERLFVSHTEMNRIDGGADWSTSEAFRRSRTQLVSYGPAYFRDNSAPYVSLAVRESEKTRSVTVAELDLRFVADAVSELTIGDSGKAYVVDSTNQLLAHPNLSLVLKKTDLSHLPQVQAAREIFGQNRPQTLPTIWGVSPEGGEVLTSAYYIPAPGWVVFVEQPAAEAMATVFGTLYRTLALLIVGLLLAFLGSRFLARTLTRPILALQQGAARIGAGDLSARLEVKTGDEIEALANEFNRMAEQLADYTAGLERKVAEKTAQLELANRHKREFLANMSHELRTPLNAIIGFSEVMKEEMFGKLNAKQAEYAADIHSSGLHLLSLINDILDLSKVEAGRMELDVAAFDVAAVVSNVLILIRDRAQQGKLKVELVVQPDMAPVEADERKLKQIVLNLVTNAVKFTRPGGRVTVTAAQDETGLTLAVADTGIGIASEDAAHVFAEFHQIRSSGEARFEGTGLGLALTKALVELHGGRISLQSEAGVGSTFTVWLPKRNG